MQLWSYLLWASVSFPDTWRIAKWFLRQMLIRVDFRTTGVTQSCQTLCNPIDCSLPGSSFHRILQARILQLVAMPFPRGSSEPRYWMWVSRIIGRFFIIRDNWRRKWLLTPVFLPGEFQGQRHMEGCSICSHKESDMTEWLTLSLLLS